MHKFFNYNIFLIFFLIAIKRPMDGAAEIVVGALDWEAFRGGFWGVGEMRSTGLRLCQLFQKSIYSLRCGVECQHPAAQSFFQNI